MCGTWSLKIWNLGKHQLNLLRGIYHFVNKWMVVDVLNSRISVAQVNNEKNKTKKALNLMFLSGWGILYLSEQVLKRCHGMDIWSTLAQVQSIVNASTLFACLNFIFVVFFLIMLFEDRYSIFSNCKMSDFLVLKWLNPLTDWALNELALERGR